MTHGVEKLPVYFSASIMFVDDLVMQGAMASADMVLT